MGKGKPGGALSGIHPADLSAHILNALAARTGLDPATVDDVVWGCVTQAGEQAGAIGRYAVLAAGWPESVPGTTVKSPLWRIVLDCIDVMAKIGGRFGLTPSDRAGIDINQVERRPATGPERILP